MSVSPREDDRLVGRKARAEAKVKPEGRGKEHHSVPPLTPRILVVDDDPAICEQFARLYTLNGYDATVALSGQQALERLAAGDIDLLVTDIHMPGMSGVELTQRVQQQWPDVPVIIITGDTEIETAVEVLKRGASDYILKPSSGPAILEATRAVLEKARVFTEIRHLRRLLKDRYEFGGMLSKTPEMHRVFEIIRMVSATDVTVLIEGETGTGKELVAQAIHHQSPRRSGPFVAINCAGFPETLLESELFGYERGAFTGADQARPGKIELAHGGTLFLDEIESMPLAMQAKLLLVLQDRKVQRLGSTRKVHIDMRVISASNIPLTDLVAKGQMRSDFYYRINVIPIRLLPLRQRPEDIPLLVQDFLHHHPVAVQRGIDKISARAMAQLMQHSWPGNVRELQNVLERAIVLTPGRTIEEFDLPQGYAPASVRVGLQNGPPTLPLREWLDEQEKLYLMQQLEACGGRIGLTASRSGVDVKTLYRKMRQHGLDKKTFQQKKTAPAPPLQADRMVGEPPSEETQG